MNLTLVSNIDFDGINHKDYPDYCDAYISSADYDGEEMTEEQLEQLNENGEFVYDKLMEHLC